ncbi:uncharacterized protein G2W53_041286 [Senna tora]|uniref:Uncharacterized protein n=1 Tax=Senna tora TaxID=362788 RepID=A0A834VZ17_9FABA|nr:uncharacterized protein G2W53_041286 [Senna tora]
MKGDITILKGEVTEIKKDVNSLKEWVLEIKDSLAKLEKKTTDENEQDRSEGFRADRGGRNMEYYFSLNHMKDGDKLKAVAVCMEGKALNYLQRLEMRRGMSLKGAIASISPITARE